MPAPLVIIVNTDKAYLELMSDILREEGYETLTLAENELAFEIIRNRQPRLVILELLILDPEPGWMILNKMRLLPATNQIPVIMASTATQLIRDNEANLRAKGCEILLKPFDLEELLTLVTRLAPI